MLFKTGTAWSEPKCRKHWNTINGRTHSVVGGAAFSFLAVYMWAIQLRHCVCVCMVCIWCVYGGREKFFMLAQNPPPPPGPIICFHSIGALGVSFKTGKTLGALQQSSSWTPSHRACWQQFIYLCKLRSSAFSYMKHKTDFFFFFYFSLPWNLFSSLKFVSVLCQCGRKPLFDRILSHNKKDAVSMFIIPAKEKRNIRISRTRNMNAWVILAMKAHKKL